MIMNLATPILHKFAECLIARERESDWPAFNYPLTENQATLGIIEKLRPQLVELMGETGFRALVMNALTRAKDEVPWLGEARLNADGSLDGLEQTPALMDSEKVSTGGAVMLAWFFGLLASFIGELLMLQLVLEIWPDLLLSGSVPEVEEPWEDARAMNAPQRFAQYHEN